MSAVAAAAPWGSVRRRLRWSLFGSLGTMATSVATLVVLSRRVDPREYGRVAVTLAIWGIAMNSIDWCGALVMRFGPVELRERGTLKTTIATRLVFALPPLLVVAVAAPILLAIRLAPGQPLGPLRSAITPLFVAGTALWILVSTAYNILQWCGIAAQRFGPLAAAGVIIKGAPLVPVAYAFAAGTLVHAEAIVGATLAGTAFASLVLYLSLGPLVAVGRPDRALLRSMWRYSLPGLLGLPSMAAFNWLDTLFLDHWSTRADVGRYQLASPAITVFAMLGASLNSVLSPELVRSGSPGDSLPLRRYRDRDQSRYALLAGLGAMGCACFAAPLVRAALPADYASTADLMALLSVAGGFLLAFWTLHPLVTATDSVWALQASYALQAITNVGLDIVLAPRLGPSGIAISNIVAWAIAFISLSLLLRRRIGARTSAILPLAATGIGVTLLLLLGAPMFARVLVGAALLGASGWGALRLGQKRDPATDLPRSKHRG